MFYIRLNLEKSLEIATGAKCSGCQALSCYKLQRSMMTLLKEICTSYQFPDRYILRCWCSLLKPKAQTFKTWFSEVPCLQLWITSPIGRTNFFEAPLLDMWESCMIHWFLNIFSKKRIYSFGSHILEFRQMAWIAKLSIVHNVNA